MPMRTCANSERTQSGGRRFGDSRYPDIRLAMPNPRFAGLEQRPDIRSREGSG